MVVEVWRGRRGWRPGEGVKVRGWSSYSLVAAAAGVEAEEQLREFPEGQREIGRRGGEGERGGGRGREEWSGRAGR